MEEQINSNAQQELNPPPRRDFKLSVPAYGIKDPEPWKPKPEFKKELSKELSDLNQKIQSTCHLEAGTLSVGFTLTPTGRVTDVKSKSGTLKGTKSEKCILKELSKYRFSSKGETNIPVTYYPFEFK